jgi:hypothetical protein
MQPRKFPFCVRVTKVAPELVQCRMRRFGLRRLPEPGGDGIARTHQQGRTDIRGGGFGFVQRERGITDHARLVAGGIARIALGDALDAQATLLCHGDQAVDRQRAAGLLETGELFQGQDVIGRGMVDLLRFGIAVEMREVGADHDQGFRPAPEPGDDLGDFRGAGLAHRQRHQRELAEHGLQEGQLHFQRMFLGVGRVGGDDLRQVGQRIQRGAIERDAAQRCGEGLHHGHRQAAHGDSVAGAEQDHAADPSGQRREQGIGLAGRAAGIDVAGVRHDHRLEPAGKSRRRRYGETGGKIVAQGIRLTGIEHAGDGRGADGGGSAHGHLTRISSNGLIV